MLALYWIPPDAEWNCLYLKWWEMEKKFSAMAMCDGGRGSVSVPAPAVLRSSFGRTQPFVGLPGISRCSTAQFRAFAKISSVFVSCYQKIWNCPSSTWKGREEKSVGTSLCRYQRKWCPIEINKFIPVKVSDISLKSAISTTFFACSSWTFIP